MAATRSPAPWPRYPPRRCGHPHSACSGSRWSTHRAELQRLGYDPGGLGGTPLWRLLGRLLLSCGGRSRWAPCAFASASSLISGSRLHHWLPTSPGAHALVGGTQFLASTPPRVASSLWVWGSVARCAVECIRLPGGYEAR